jgi:outer membrane protein
MRKEMKRYFVLSLLLITGLLSAKTITLENLIETGLNNAYSVRQNEIMLKNADLSVRSATWGLLPSADVSASRSNTDGRYSSSGSLAFAKTLTLNEPTYFNYKQAGLDKTIARLDWQQAKKELVYSIYSAWLDINQTRKEIAIQTENLSVLQRIKEQSVMQKQLGQRTSFDVSQTDINVINAELVIAELTNQLAKQRADLFNQIKLKDNGEELEEAVITTTDLNLDFSKSTEQTYLMTKLKEDMRKTQLDKLEQKIGLFPSLVLAGRYDQHSVNNDVLKFADYEDSYTLSIGLSWSLWTPWTKGSNYSQIRNNLLLKQWQYDESQATQSLNQSNLQRDWQYLQESLNLNTRKAAQAKDNLRIAQEKYNLGSFSLIELEQARVSSLDAELALNKITYQLQKKIQEWNLLNSLPVLNKY